MSSPLELVSIQYALALLVGQDLDLRVMLRKFLPPALKLLNCRSGYLWLPTGGAIPANGFEPCYSYPTLKAPLTQKWPEMAACIQQIATNGWRLEKPVEIIHADGRYCHFLPIGTTGLLVLQRNPSLSTSQLLALQPVLNRLETACRACLQHACLEAARQDALQAKAAAEQANQDKSDFLAMISHEIRTPMNGVIGLTDLMLYSEVSPSQREYLDMIKSSSTALLDIINEILDFSRIEAGALKLSPQPFSLRALLQATFIPLAVQAREKSLAFHWDMATDVPDTLEGDAGRLRQILVNLVGNAIKFTESGGEVSIGISLQADAPAGYARLGFSVRDTGIGIPRDQQASVFQPFQQADTSISRRYGGTGLGLAISAQLVAMMGGTLQLESESACGSIFHFSILFRQETLFPPPPTTHRVLVQAKRPLNILLAEDNTLNSLFTVLLLNKAGHMVTVAANGREAVDNWLQHRPDTILMDMQMPVMDGLEAAALIRQHEQATATRTPIIALTANMMESDREKCLQAGMDDFLSKPFDAQDLLGRLEQIGI